jgi:glucose/arabinose dehydrogenase
MSGHRFTWQTGRVPAPASLSRRRLVGALLATLCVAGCSAGAAGQSPTWVPQPDFQGNNEPQPQVPNPGNEFPAPNPSAPGTGVPQPSQPGGSESPGAPTPGPSSPATDPAVVATKLNQPTGIVVLPDGTALVGERTTGRILRVQPRPGQPVQLVHTLAGVDGSGDGGLLDLALAPTFNEDGLIYAYLTTATDNRVVHFTLSSAPSAVITGIPKGRTGNVGRIAFDATGALLTGTGDAGQPALAQNPASLAGKILRTSDLGKALADNPVAGSRVFARGLHTVNGLCVDPKSGTRFALSSGTPDQVNIIKPGADYGWPTHLANSTDPAKTLPPTTAGAGGCTARNGRLTVATSTGMSLVVAGVNQTVTIGTFTSTIQRKYGRLRSVVSAADGSLWLTTSNRDGHGRPIADDDRVVRILPSEAGGPNVV